MGGGFKREVIREGRGVKRTGSVLKITSGARYKGRTRGGTMSGGERKHQESRDEREEKGRGFVKGWTKGAGRKHKEMEATRRQVGDREEKDVTS